MASGPNSILFGFASPGGLVNVSSKVAEVDRTRSRIRAQYGSWDYKRTEVDHNQVVLPGRLALRLNGLWEDADSWREFGFNRSNRGAASIRYTPWKTSAVTVNYERGHIEEFITRPFTALDARQLWLDSGSPTKDVATFNAKPDQDQGMNRISRIVFVQGDGAGEDSYFLRGNYLESTYETLNTTTLPAANRVGDTLLSEEEMPYEANDYGRGATKHNDFDRVMARFEHRFTDNIVLDVAVHDEKAHVTGLTPQGPAISLKGDPNLTLPLATGGSLQNPQAGQQYMEELWWLDESYFRNRVGRAALSWTVDLGPALGRHNLAGMAEIARRRQTTHKDREMLVDANNIPIANAMPENAANRLYRRHYITPGDYSTYYAGDGTEPASFTANGQTYRSRYVHSTYAGNDIERSIDTLLIATQSFFWQDRIVMSGGLRFDDITYDQHEGGRYTADDPAVISGERLLNELTFLDRIDQRYVYHPTTFTLGAVWHVTPMLSLFFNASNNDSQPSVVKLILPDRTLPPLVEGETQDAGFMLNLLEGKMFLRVTAFETSQLKTLVAGLRTDDTNPELPSNRILTALRDTNHITAAEYQDRFIPDADQGFLSATGDVVNRGVEASLWLNLTANLTGVINYSHTKVDRSGIYPEFDPWFAAQKELWLRDASAGSVVTESGQTVTQEISYLETQARGVRIDNDFGFGERPDKANASLRYKFGDGSLKGLFLGGGVRWQSAMKIGRELTGKDASGNNTYGKTYYGKETFNSDAFIGYRRPLEWGGLDAEILVQLNVTNITDEDVFQVLRYNNDNSGAQRGLLGEPRSYRLTVGLEF